MLRLCEDNQVRLIPQFIPSCMNVLADSLSRRPQVLGSEWALCHQAFQELLCWWPATIDLCATSLNARLPVYFSPIADLQSAGTDAMFQSWDSLQTYAFPPFGLLHRVLAKARQSWGLDPCGSVLASAPLVSQPSGGCPSVPSTAEGSTQTASLPSFPPEFPRASSDCVSYLERFVQSFGFTSAVAH